MNERKKKYTDKENRRRYRLHYKARKQGVEICTAEKTCKIPVNTKTNHFTDCLVAEFHYAVQFIITPPQKNNCEFIEQ